MHAWRPRFGHFTQLDGTASPRFVSGQSGLWSRRRREGLPCGGWGCFWMKTGFGCQSFCTEMPWVAWVWTPCESRGRKKNLWQPTSREAITAFLCWPKMGKVVCLSNAWWRLSRIQNGVMRNENEPDSTFEKKSPRAAIANKNLQPAEWADMGRAKLKAPATWLIKPCGLVRIDGDLIGWSYSDSHGARCRAWSLVRPIFYPVAFGTIGAAGRWVFVLVVFNAWHWVDKEDKKTFIKWG